MAYAEAHQGVSREDLEADTRLMLHELQYAGFTPTWERIADITDSCIRPIVSALLDILQSGYSPDERFVSFRYTTGE